MELNKFRPLIILGAIVVVLLLILVFIKASNVSSTQSEEKEKKDNTVYPEVTDNEEAILAKVYNPKYDYYTGFINKSGDTEYVFGNKHELFAKNMDQRTRMSVALYSFDLSDFNKINCNTVSWSNSWGSVCGSNSGNMAYYIPVSELNNRIEEIFNIRPDYSLLDIDDLEIGLCSGENTSQYKFRYIKDRSIFVSVKRNGLCQNNGKIKVTSVSKTQNNGLITLDVFYQKIPTININNKIYYNSAQNYQDKFYFKVKKDGSYYFSSSTLFKEID